MSRFRTTALLLSAVLVGCAASRSPIVSDDALLGRQLQKQDADLIGQQFRTLLDFEHPQDFVFVSPTFAGQNAGHTGKTALLADKSATVNVSSLLYGAALPGAWTLVGGYVRGGGGRVSAVLLADGREIARTTRAAPNGVDLFAAVDLTTDACRRTLPKAKTIELRLETAGQFALDDVMLVDNRRTLVDTAAEPKLGWTVRVDGLSLSLHSAAFQTTVPLVSGDVGGWAIDEANAVRVRLRDSAGSIWTILPDGRSVREGHMTSLAGRRAAAAPADVTVDESTGRLDRETAGDIDNDGYNERRGAYQLVAAGPRMKLRLSPHGPSADPPVLEIRGLPAEHTTVTVDGRLIDQTARLSDGTLLVLVPVTLAKTVELTVGVSGE